MNTRSSFGDDASYAVSLELEVPPPSGGLGGNATESTHRSGVLGELSTTQWLEPEPKKLPGIGLAAEALDPAAAETVYLSSIKGDAAAISAALADAKEGGWTIRDAYGVEPLGLAARAGHAEAVAALIDGGAGLNAQCETVGITALHRAAQKGHAAVVDALLGAGADANAEARDGQTALHYASSSGMAEAAGALLDGGAALEQKDLTGHTPLMAAAAGGHAGAVEALLGRGADLAATDENGWSALHFACHNGRLEAAAALARRGGAAAANATTSGGCTAASMHAEVGEEVRRIVAANPDGEAADADGEGEAAPLA